MSIFKSGALVILFGVMAACTGPARLADAAGAPEKIFETNVTNDLNLTSGEPEIAVDPTNPRHLAITELALGSDQVPAASYDPISVVLHPAGPDPVG